MNLGGGVAQPPGEPEIVGEAVGQLAEAGQLLLVRVRAEALVIFVIKAGESACIEKFHRSPIVVIDVPALVEIETADNPFERSFMGGCEAQLLHEDVVIGIGVQGEGNGLTERTRQVDDEILVEIGQGR